jgi:hypothetical protein
MQGGIVCAMTKKGFGQRRLRIDRFCGSERKSSARLNIPRDF